MSSRCTPLFKAGSCNRWPTSRRLLLYGLAWRDGAVPSNRCASDATDVTLRKDTETGQLVEFEPGQEAENDREIREDGKVKQHMSTAAKLGRAIDDTLDDPDKRASMVGHLMDGVKEFDTEGVGGRRRGFQIVIHGKPTDPMARPGMPVVMRTRPNQGTAKELPAAQQAAPQPTPPQPQAAARPAPQVPPGAGKPRGPRGEPTDGLTGDTFEDVSNIGVDEDPYPQPRVSQPPSAPPRTNMTPMRPWGT